MFPLSFLMLCSGGTRGLSVPEMDVVGSEVGPGPRRSAIELRQSAPSAPVLRGLRAFASPVGQAELRQSQRPLPSGRLGTRRATGVSVS